jgi:hypothetical protein
MKKPLEVSKSIELKWTEGSQALIKNFWIERGFKISTGSGGCISGRRGHILSNLTGYNMARLRCKLIVCERNHDEIIATMEIDTTGQIITEENSRFFELEMDTFESVMRSGDRLERVWSDFKKEQRKSNFLWTITLGLYGFRPLLQAIRKATKKPNKS